MGISSNTIIEKLNIVYKEMISHNRVLKYIRADDQFVTSEILNWCDNSAPQIKNFLVYHMNANKLKNLSDLIKLGKIQ